MKRQLIDAETMAYKLASIHRNTESTEFVLSRKQYKKLADRQQLRPSFCLEVERVLENLGLLQILIYTNSYQRRIKLILIGSRSNIIRRLRRNIMRDDVIVEASNE